MAYPYGVAGGRILADSYLATYDLVSFPRERQKREMHGPRYGANLASVRFTKNFVAG